MTRPKKSNRDDLLAQVIGVGAGRPQESALGTGQVPVPVAAKPVGRPPQGPTIPFTLRLSQEGAERLQRLVSDLQARAIRGELPRRDATIAAVVEEGLRLYDKKHGGTK